MPTPQDLAYPPVAFHFAVSFGTASRDADCSFSEVSGISSEMETETVVEGGENRYVYQLPKAVKHQRLVLKRGVAPFSSRLVSWCRDVLEGGLTRPVTTKLMRVTLLDATGQPLRVWSFDGAFPVKWDVEPFQSTKSDVALEKVELSYLFAKREV
ncbi:MAG: phage tail protein [Leptothrix sp. (in: b-proteobacteria)]